MTLTWRHLDWTLIWQLLCPFAPRNSRTLPNELLYYFRGNIIDPTRRTSWTHLGGHLDPYLEVIIDLLLQNIFVHNLANILTFLRDIFALHITDILTTSWRKIRPLTEDILIFTWRASWSLPGGHLDLYLEDILIFTWGTSWSLPGGHLDLYLEDILMFTWRTSWSLPGGHLDLGDLCETAVSLDLELSHHQGLGYHHQHVHSLVVQQRSSRKIYT